MPSRLILNADDFGQTPGINQAIEVLHRAGALTSATLMACGQAFDHAVAIAQANPRLGVGCHVVLVDGTPIASPDAIPSLLGPDGRTFRTSIFDFARNAVLGRIREDEIEREARAQIQRLQSAGIHVTHLDTHKHTHLFPSVLAPLLRAAQDCGIPALRRPFEPRWSARYADAPVTRRLQLRVLARFSGRFDQLTSTLRARRFVPDGTLGIAATGTLNEGRLRSMLNALPQNGIYELCCHPGHMDAALATQTTRLRESRETEYRAILTVLPEILRTPGAPRLIHYGDLLSGE